jgi:putative SOS response-associated peptidase YedK
MWDIYSMETVPVISFQHGSLFAENKKWGSPRFDSKKVVYNARAESVLERKMFRDSVLRRHIVISAIGFYEWNRLKEKVTFRLSLKEQSIMYMDGLFNKYTNEDRFVILTTGANDSIADVHERMPLLLQYQELEECIQDDTRLEEFLYSQPHGLKREMEF